MNFRQALSKWSKSLWQLNVIFNLAIRWQDAMVTRVLFPRIARRRYADFADGTPVDIVLNPLGVP